MRPGLFVLFFALFSPSLFSQGIGIGQWREHLPHSQGRAVTASDHKVYCATEHAVFSLDKRDNSLSFLTRINGLSDVGISAINYHHPTKTLVIAYSNSNIDLIRPSGQIVNVADIYRKSMTGNKTINHISFRGNLAYLACGFGIVVLDMEQEEVRDTYIIGPEATYLNVLALAINDTTIFAATENGLYLAHDYQNKNLLDFRSWEKDSSMIKPHAPYSDIAIFQNYLFVINPNPGYATDTLFYYHNGQWDYYDTINQVDNFFRIRAFEDILVLVAEDNIDLIDTSLTLLRKIYTYGDSHPRARDALLDEDGYVYVADHSQGLAKSPRQWLFEIINPGGPRYINNWSMAYGSGTVWVATGTINSSWGNLYQRTGIARFAGNRWQSWHLQNEPAFDTIFDVVDIAVNPSNGSHAFAASWGKGLIEMKDGHPVNVYTPENSTLEYRPGQNFLGVAGVTFDRNQNLWVTNSFVANGLSMRTINGEWRSFDLRPAVASNELGELIIDDLGQKWIIAPRGGGIIVFNHNETYDNPHDDRVIRLSTTEGNGNLPSSNVMALAKDRDGVIWIGTDEGIAVVYSPGNVFTGQNFDAQQIFIPRGDGTNLGTFLLETETVTDILVDGANRKWIGTARGGLFLMSPEGTRQIQHFTRENSPLLSNAITSLAMNDQTGELFIGTDKGILSYKGEATKGQEQHMDAYAYPNPVPSGYNGKIAIKGLVTDANVKITDVAGNLIFQTIARGGQAIWNGKNFQGQKAHSGVYLVFSSNQNGEETMVTKILFMR